MTKPLENRINEFERYPKHKMTHTLLLCVCVCVCVCGEKMTYIMYGFEVLWKGISQSKHI